METFDFKEARLSKDGPPLGRMPNNGEVVELDSEGYRVVWCDGNDLHTPDYNACKVQELLKSRFVVPKSDVTIATFPKCGTTWMQQIILLLLAEGDAQQVTNPMGQAPWLEMAVGRDGFDVDSIRPSVGSRRVWKTHAQVSQLPWLDREPGQKIIVVTRNACDTAVSMWHHSRDVPCFGYSGDWEHFLRKIFLKGLNEQGSYWAWHQGWVEYTHSPQNKGTVLWVRYEDLKKDAVHEIARVAAFLDIAASPELIRKVAGGSGFTAMKQQFNALEKTLTEEGKADKIKKNHIRQGVVGGWRQMFTPEQLEAFAAVDGSFSFEEDIANFIASHDTPSKKEQAAACSPDCASSIGHLLIHARPQKALAAA